MGLLETPSINAAVSHYPSTSLVHCLLLTTIHGYRCSQALITLRILLRLPGSSGRSAPSTRASSLSPCLDPYTSPTLIRRPKPIAIPCNDEERGCLLMPRRARLISHQPHSQPSSRCLSSSAPPQGHLSNRFWPTIDRVRAAMTTLHGHTYRLRSVGHHSCLLIPCRWQRLTAIMHAVAADRPSPKTKEETCSRRSLPISAKAFAG